MAMHLQLQWDGNERCSARMHDDMKVKFWECVPALQDNANTLVTQNVSGQDVLTPYSTSRGDARSFVVMAAGAARSADSITIRPRSNGARVTCRLSPAESTGRGCRAGKPSVRSSVARHMIAFLALGGDVRQACDDSSNTGGTSFIRCPRTVAPCGVFLWHELRHDHRPPGAPCRRPLALRRMSNLRGRRSRIA
jgi:hypothetical protein